MKKGMVYKMEFNQSLKQIWLHMQVSNEKEIKQKSPFTTEIH